MIKDKSVQSNESRVKVRIYKIEKELIDFPHWLVSFDKAEG